MSENAITVVELSLDDASARSRADATREWLLSTGVVAMNTKRDELWQPSEFRAGPSVLRAVDVWGPDDARGANSGVDVVVGRELHHSMENFEPPACPGCAFALELDDERHAALIEGWLGGVEPVVTCRRCHRFAPLGDWTGEWMFAVGNLAVRFNNWPPLREEFVEALKQQLGPRCRLVLTHC
jgi:hypothetical protein